MADSISGTVTAMICVVVGLLIIGCALVPVVEQASTTKATATGGTNTYTGASWFGTEPLADTNLEITTSNNIMTINGVTYPSGNRVELYTGSFGDRDNGDRVTNSAADNIKISGKTYTIDGETKTYDWVSTSSIDLAKLFNNSLSSIYCEMSSATIGASQAAYGWDNNDAWAKITVDSSVPDGFSRTTNDDGTASVAAPYGTVGPIEWLKTTVTTSEYAALYAIIPIMCILGMAYVLIRRF